MTIWWQGQGISTPDSIGKTAGGQRARKGYGCKGQTDCTCSEGLTHRSPVEGWGWVRTRQNPHWPHKSLQVTPGRSYFKGLKQRSAFFFFSRSCEPKWDLDMVRGSFNPTNIQWHPWAGDCFTALVMRRWHGHFRDSDSTPRICPLDSSSNLPLSAGIPRRLLFQEQGQNNLQKEASVCHLWGSVWQGSSWCFQPALPQVMEAGKGMTQAWQHAQWMPFIYCHHRKPTALWRGASAPPLLRCDFAMNGLCLSPSCLYPWSPAGFVAILLSLWAFVC